jgi:hypothetical protein
MGTGALTVVGIAFVKLGPADFATAGFVVGVAPGIGASAVLGATLLVAPGTEGLAAEPGTGVFGGPDCTFAGSVFVAEEAATFAVTGAEPGVTGLLPAAPAGLATGFEAGALVGFAPETVAGLGIGPFAVEVARGFEGAPLIGAVAVGLLPGVIEAATGFVAVVGVPVGAFGAGMPCFTGMETGLGPDPGATEGALEATLAVGAPGGAPVVFGGAAFVGGVGVLAGAGALTVACTGTELWTSAIAKY